MVGCFFTFSRLLLQPSIDINTADDDGITAFEFLLHNGSREVLDILEVFKDLGDKLDILETGAFSAACSAQEYPKSNDNINIGKERCEWLLNNYPNINVTKTFEDEGPLHWAINNDNQELAKFLFKVDGIDVNQICYDNTPIMQAIEHTNIPMFLLILSNPNVDLRMVNRKGKSVLHSACEADTGRAFLVKKLMQTGKFSEKEKTDCENGKYWKHLINNKK